MQQAFVRSGGSSSIWIFRPKETWIEGEGNIVPAHHVDGTGALHAYTLALVHPSSPLNIALVGN